MDTGEEQRRSFNVRLGHQTTSWPILVNGDNAQNAASQGSSPSQLSHGQQQVIRAFLQQKPHRVHQNVLFRKAMYIILTIISMLSAWAIGYYGFSIVFLIALVVCMYIFWKDQSHKIAFDTEQEIEMKIRRKKAMQMSETAEWVNHAINRWWMACNESVFGFMKDYIEPLLQEIVPTGIDSLEFVELDLANQTPFVKNIQIFDPPTTSIDESQSSTKGAIVANIEIGLMAPDSKLVLKARVGGKKIGYDTLVYVEGLHLSGNVQAIIHFDYEAPFPHLSCISATFTRSPDLWYAVRVLKGLKVTDVPLVKSFIHSFIMSIFQSLLVDPGRLEIDLMSTGPRSIADPQNTRRARGVMTITFNANPPEKSSNYENDSRRWFGARLGSQKYQKQLPTGRDNWTATYSYLVYDFSDVLFLKIKHHRVMYTMTLAVHSINLDTLGFLNEEGEELQTTKHLSVSNPEANIALDIEYTPLPPFSLNYAVPLINSNQNSGVLYVHVHSATGLKSDDVDELSDPYCVVLADKKRVLTTHYILDTLEPKWERGVEIFVHDFTQVSLTFVVYDWDGPLVGDAFLGACKLNLEIDKPAILHKQIDLEIDGSSVINDKPLGSIIISAVFREVESVSKSEISSNYNVNKSDYTAEQPIHSSKVSSKEQWKKLKGLGGLLPDFGVIEVSIIEGKNLKAMDRNGYSDPYLIVKYGVHEMYRTHFVNKSLNPKWNCHCTLSAPPSTAAIVIECWDKDQFTNDDFMGSIAFTGDDLSMFESGPKWCKLEHVSSGEILIELKKTEASKLLLTQLPTDSLSSGDISETLNFNEAQFNEGSEEQDDKGAAEATNVPAIALSEVSPTRSLSPSFSTPQIVPEVTGTSRVKMRKRNTVRGGSISHRESYTPSIGSGDSSISGSTNSLSQTLGTPDDFNKKKNKRSSFSLSSSRRGIVLDANFIPMLYHNVNGEILEVTGLKGKLDDLELYLKLRLNIHPSHMRRQKFDRGPLLHKTRRLKGNSSLVFNELFTVKEDSIPTESLLTIDLKSNPHVTLGTHVITLDKFFENNMHAKKSLDLGNEMKVTLKMSHHLPHARSMEFNNGR